MNIIIISWTLIGVHTDTNVIYQNDLEKNTCESQISSVCIAKRCNHDIVMSFHCDIVKSDTSGLYDYPFKLVYFSNIYVTAFLRMPHRRIEGFLDMDLRTTTELCPRRHSPMDQHLICGPDVLGTTLHYHLAVHHWSQSTQRCHCSQHREVRSRPSAQILMI